MQVSDGALLRPRSLLDGGLGRLFDPDVDHYSGVSRRWGTLTFCLLHASYATTVSYAVLRSSAMTARTLAALAVAALLGFVVAYVCATLGRAHLDPDAGAAGFLLALALLYVAVPAIVRRALHP